MYIFFYTSPFGKYALVEEKNALTKLLFENAILPGEVVVKETALMKEAHGQLEAYFQGKRTIFDLPFSPGKDSFSENIWDALRDIPTAQQSPTKR